MEARIAKLEEKCIAISKQIDTLQENAEEIRNLAIGVARMTETLEFMQKELSGVNSRLEEIEKKPADRWESFIKQVITLLTGAVITYLLTQAGIL